MANFPAFAAAGNALLNKISLNMFTLGNFFRLRAPETVSGQCAGI